MSRFHLQRNILWLEWLENGREISVGAELLWRLRRDHITFVPDLWILWTIPTDLNLRVMLCLQEDLRAQLRKMEAGASDKDKVEAPNESTNDIMDMWHVKHVQHHLLRRQVRRETYSKICLVCFLDSHEIDKICLHFPAVHCVWCKYVKAAVLPWVDFLWTLSGMMSLQRFLGLLGFHAFVNFASAGHVIKPYQDVSKLTSLSQYGRASTFW